MYIVYVLKSDIALKTYVGMTDNLERRLSEHNTGLSVFTKRFLPWSVVYTEICDTRQSARKREKYFKSGAGRNFLAKNIFKK